MNRLKQREKAVHGYAEGDKNHKHPRTDLLNLDLVKTFDKINALDHHGDAVAWKVSSHVRNIDPSKTTKYISVSLPEAMLRKAMSLIDKRIKEQQGVEVEKEFQQLMYGRRKKVDYSLLLYVLVVLCYPLEDREGLTKMASSPLRTTKVMDILSSQTLTNDDVISIKSMLLSIGEQQADNDQQIMAENQSLRKENQQLRHQLEALNQKLGDIAVQLFSQNHAAYSVLAGISRGQETVQNALKKKGVVSSVYKLPYILQDEIRGGLDKKVYRAQDEPKTELYKKTASFESHRKMDTLGKIDYDKINKKYSSDTKKPKVDF